jgi:exopolysaccharide/PEP-CTERM locus tyrosine autokinase
VGKIFDALEKFSKERGRPVSDRVKDSDYEVLMQFDEATARIDVADPRIVKDQRVLERLKTYRLINDDGTLTPAGRAKYEERLGRSKVAAAGEEARTVAKPTLDQKEPVPHGFEKARQSDWALLMNYDRQTGNLLKYDSQTGELDENSRSILQNSATVQRLIDNQMILPGGWLTPEARRECSRLQEKHKDEELKSSEKQEKAVRREKPEPVSEPADSVSQADMEALQDYDQETLKLNVKNPLILKNPEILKRFLEKGLIDAEGKLSAKALVRCQVLARWKKEFEKKEPEPPKPRPKMGEKLQTIAEKSKPQETSAEAGEKKLKIIPLKNDKIEKKSENKIEDKTEQKIKDKIEIKPEAKREEEKSPQKTDNFITALEAKNTLAEPAGVPSEGKFTLGEVPASYARSEIDKELITIKNPQSFEAEQFKILRTNLLFAESGKKPRSVMVTSAVPGEGKSFVAANLAVSVARHVNWNVLLMDCDLRRPSVHRQFGYQNVPGLSNYLTNGTPLSQLLLKTGIKNLTILPAGKQPDNPSELLSSERMADLLREVTARYDDRLIIIDSPPPKLTAESGALARYVDGILLIVKYASTPREAVTELVAKLGRDKIIGAVVNNFDAGSPRYHKKYYGGTYFAKS